MGDFRILVTGSRDWPRADRVRAALLEVALPAIADGRRVVVVHGDARGVDSLAGSWARRRGVPVIEEPHPADWSRGGSAGYRRNAEMVALGADVCLAFIARCVKETCLQGKPHGSHGATHCADLAERTGIPTKRFGPVT